MHSVSGHRFTKAARIAACGLCGIAALSISGCGNAYRPVVAAINPVGPAAQPLKYAVAISDPGNGQSGLITLVDFSGDTILSNAYVAPQPTFFALDSSSIGYVLHKQSVLVDTFAASSSLQTFNGSNVINHASLQEGLYPTSITPTLSGSPIFITQPGASQVALLTGGDPPTAREQLSVPANPTYTIAQQGAARAFTLSAGATPGTSNGTATAIEIKGTNPISASIPVGRTPIYGVMDATSQRAFVLNSAGDSLSGGNGTVSVIDVTADALDSGAVHTTTGLDTTVSSIPVGPNPVWADIAPLINELAVVNQGDGVHPGSLTIINTELCSSITLAGQTTCSTVNPTDAVGFGQVLATVPVGVKPVMVSIDRQFNKAYVANAGDSTVTVVDLETMTATRTIPIGGTLNWIAATSGTPTGKVYVTASDTQNLTVVRTDSDQIYTTIPLQGNGVAVRVTAP